MGTFTQFLERLFYHGEVVLAQRPLLAEDDSTTVLKCLREAYEEIAFDIAGPILDFNSTIGLRAAQLTADACWYLIARHEPAEAVTTAFADLPKPQTAADHLSADLTFRYLPVVYRRAYALRSDDELTLRLADLLRAWPLSGVLCSVIEGPTSSLDFLGHRGLQQMYAERLLTHHRPAWVPGSGPTREWFDLLNAGRQGTPQ